MTRKNLENAASVAKLFNAWSERVIRSGSAMGERMEESLGVGGRSFVTLLTRFQKMANDPKDDIDCAEQYAAAFARAGYAPEDTGKLFALRCLQGRDNPAEALRKIPAVPAPAFKAVFGVKE